MSNDDLIPPLSIHSGFTEDEVAVGRYLSGVGDRGAGLSDIALNALGSDSLAAVTRAERAVDNLHNEHVVLAMRYFSAERWAS